MKRLSKPFYVWSVAIGMALYIILFLMPTPWPFSPLLAACLVIICLFGWVVFLVLTYKMWAAIQDGFARTTPGKAVGYLFIPFYNLYWVFQAYWGFAKDCNAYIDRYDGIYSTASKLPVGLFLAYPVVIVSVAALALIALILIIVGLLPLGLAASALSDLGLLAEAVITVVMVVKACDAVNSLPVPSSTAVEK